MTAIGIWTEEPWFSSAKYPSIYEHFVVTPLTTEASLREKSPQVLVVDEPIYRRFQSDIHAFSTNGGHVLVPVIAVSASPRDLEEEKNLFDVLETIPSEKALVRSLSHAKRFFEMQRELMKAREAHREKANELEELLSIGAALSSEKDHGRLLDMILKKAREITNADAGSLFVIEQIDMPLELETAMKRASGKWLRFRLAENDSLDLDFQEEVMPITPASVAGFVAGNGETVNLADAYNPPPALPFELNRRFDEATGYQTRSMLVVPMQNAKGEVIGVLQLINKKTERNIKLSEPESFDRYVVPFDELDQRLLHSLASQAAVSIENNNLYYRIERLFADFVEASVRAIESRDPTTRGHSRRVARMTTELAEVTNRCENGQYGSLILGEEALRELKYAALLHDFGKVGVREKVLVKATKLYHGELSVITERFRTIRRTMEAQHLRGFIERLMRGEASEAELQDMEEELRRESERVEDALEAVLSANQPSVTDRLDLPDIESIAQMTFPDFDGSDRRFLEADELRALSLLRGTLTEGEREEIQRHVVHTFDFLNTIPWTGDLQNVPFIARSHHEKLDGSGYPHGLSAEQIPPQTRMMTIADIFDALAARDRPYKKAVPTERALDILVKEASAGHVDRDLLDLFIDAKVYRLAAQPD